MQLDFSLFEVKHSALEVIRQAYEEKLASTLRLLGYHLQQIIRRSLVTKMVKEHHVNGYEEFTKLVERLETSGELVHVLFSGGKDDTGRSWCPYCNQAEPVVTEALIHAPEDSNFIHVNVGERAYWKDPNCPFRKDPRTHLVFLPTLLRWKSPQRLDGSKCSDADLVEMLFTDDD